MYITLCSYSYIWNVTKRSRFYMRGERHGFWPSPQGEKVSRLSFSSWPSILLSKVTVLCSLHNYINTHLPILYISLSDMQGNVNYIMSRFFAWQTGRFVYIKLIMLSVMEIMLDKLGNFCGIKNKFLVFCSWQQNIYT